MAYIVIFAFFIISHGNLSRPQYKVDFDIYRTSLQRYFNGIIKKLPCREINFVERLKAGVEGRDVTEIFTADTLGNP